MIDPETKAIKYVNKKDVFARLQRSHVGHSPDQVYTGVVSNVESVNNSKNKNQKLRKLLKKLKIYPFHKKC
jgi:cell shape-determining protein MreC